MSAKLELARLPGGACTLEGRPFQSPLLTDEPERPRTQPRKQVREEQIVNRVRV